MCVVDGNRMTSAGGTSVVHLAAHLIERHCGCERASKSPRYHDREPAAALQLTPQLPNRRSRGRRRMVPLCGAMLLNEQKRSQPDPLTDILALPDRYAANGAVFA
ncbi:MAG: hypothetical protein IPI73_25410 [Betaproteobacteria bacterium]|nr:hypothetical protein [Betaproteobacteria bacterium]